MGDNPPPNKKQKRWHNLKEKKKKKSRAFEKLDTIETKEDVRPQAIDNAVDQDNTKTDDKNNRERDPFPVFIFNATRKNVTVEVKSRKSRNKRKGTNSIQTNKILGYFKN